MTENQGVAQRVIERILFRTITETNDEAHSFALGERVGAETMHHELSREARAIIQAKRANLKHLVADTLEMFCKELGLTLEEEQK